MITKFKIFENNNKPEVGDYCLIEFLGMDSENKGFIENNIGKILKIYPDEKDIWNHTKIGDILVGYEDVPIDMKSYFGKISGFYTRKFLPYQIIEFSKTKEELERKLAQKKYNL